jgi:hypothetical protein
MLEIQYRPMRDNSWKRSPSKRKPSLFKSNWLATMTLLEREITSLKGFDVTIEVEVLPAAIRADGTGLRANQRPASDAVIVSFDTKSRGAFTWRADEYTKPNYGSGEGWRHNVHAVAKTLEALRAVERYGLVSGQQYEGLAALPAGRGSSASHMTADEARQLIIEILGAFDGAAARGDTAAQIRRARGLAHPDRRNGDRTLWDQVEQAARVLGVDQ